MSVLSLYISLGELKEGTMDAIKNGSVGPDDFCLHISLRSAFDVAVIIF